VVLGVRTGSGRNPRGAPGSSSGSVPVGFTTFPGEIWAASRSWVETVYPTLAYFHEVDRGGHFAAWEEPELFSQEARSRSGRFARTEPLGDDCVSRTEFSERSPE
jgi:hypothetical protein